jgi:toxin ParE1/3/4
MRIEYSRRTETDLDAIFNYLYERNPEAATTVLATISRRIARLQNFPLMAPPSKRPGVRCLTITRYPYQVYYQLRGDLISVLHIRHARRAPWKGAE